MRRLSRPQIAVQLETLGLVPLFYHQDPEIVKSVVLSCYKGGARFFEFTNRGELAHEVFNEVIKFSRKQCPEMILGVGSITDAASASLYMALGAEFIVSPVLREDIALICNRRKILYLPGCSSLGEITRAEELGCEIAKLFPATVLGPNFVKAVKAPQPWTSIMPSGGVTPERENLEDWFNAGVTCVGMGSSLISNEVVQKRDFEGLEKKVAEVKKLISEIRKG